MYLLLFRLQIRKKKTTCLNGNDVAFLQENKGYMDVAAKVVLAGSSFLMWFYEAYNQINNEASHIHLQNHMLHIIQNIMQPSMF